MFGKQREINAKNQEMRFLGSHERAQRIPTPRIVLNPKGRTSCIHGIEEQPGYDLARLENHPKTQARPKTQDRRSIERGRRTGNPSSVTAYVQRRNDPSALRFLRNHFQRFRWVFSGLYRIEQLPEASHPPFTRDGQDCGTRRAWCPGLERVTECGQGEAVLRVLGQDTEVPRTTSTGFLSSRASGKGVPGCGITRIDPSRMRSRSLVFGIMLSESPSRARQTRS